MLVALLVHVPSEVPAADATSFLIGISVELADIIVLRFCISPYITQSKDITG